jgi:inhibitor of KinA
LGSEIDEPTRIRVQNAAATLAAASLPGVQDVVPGFTTITLHYDLKHAAVEALVSRIERALSLVSDIRTGDERLVRIPVCYGGTFGPDLDDVAARTELSAAAVIERHTAQEYRVYMLGFLPGFAYLGGLDPGIAVPRRAAPRDRVPAGSVGIAGVQTGVYPLESPGGWQLIGRSPCRMFDPSADPPTLLRPGDRVRFDAIEPSAFQSAKVGVE